MENEDKDNKNNGKTQRDIGRIEGKMEMMISSQANFEQKREDDVKHIFNKIDGIGREMRGVISEGNRRIHQRLDEHIKEMKRTNEEQDKQINVLEKKQDGTIRTASIAGSTAGGLIGGMLGFFSKFLGGGHS